jgi:hypothetical protein
VGVGLVALESLEGIFVDRQDGNEGERDCSPGEENGIVIDACIDTDQKIFGALECQKRCNGTTISGLLTDISTLRGRSAASSGPRWAKSPTNN